MPTCGPFWAVCSTCPPHRLDGRRDASPSFTSHLSTQPYAPAALPTGMRQGERKATKKIYRQMGLLSGKTAIVTGAARGIGKAIALKFAQEGCNVAFTDLVIDENGEATRQEIEALGVKCKAYASNAANFAETEEVVKQIHADFGSIDILVNNAGITKDGLMVRMSEEQYDAVIAVNQKSVFNMMKLVGAVMMRQRHGHIVSLASVAGLYGNPGQINYSASKAAIIGMTKTVAKELGARNVTVNAVAPGFIKTPMTDALTEEQRNKMLELVAMKRYGNPEEVANVISFLCSEDASYVTGQTIEISGGLMM